MSLNNKYKQSIYQKTIAKKVSLIHRRDTLRSDKILQDRLFKKQKEGKINIIWDHNLKEVSGNGSLVNSISIQHATSLKTSSLKIEGVFIAIGHKPNTDLFINQLKMKDGYIIVNSGIKGSATATSIPGVFAAGDVSDHIYRQAITSAGSGCMAALDAKKYLDNLNS